MKKINGFFRPLRRLFRPSPPPLLPPPPPPVTPPVFHDTFAYGLGQWEFETGDRFVGDQEYTSHNYTAAREGIVLVAHPHGRTSARLVSLAAPFVRGTRLSYLAELDPAHEAVWPALWAIGRSLNWPACGEVDVMECGLGGQWEIKQTVHTSETYADDARRDYGCGPGPRSVPNGPAVYSAEWRDEGIRFAVNGAHTGTVAYDATEPLRLVMNVALRPGVALDREWSMRVRAVLVERLP